MMGREEGQVRGDGRAEASRRRRCAAQCWPCQGLARSRVPGAETKHVCRRGDLLLRAVLGGACTARQGEGLGSSRCWVAMMGGHDGCWPLSPRRQPGALTRQPGRGGDPALHEGKGVAPRRRQHRAGPAAGSHGGVAALQARRQLAGVRGAAGEGSGGSVYEMQCNQGREGGASPLDCPLLASPLEAGLRTWRGAAWRGRPPPR